MNLTNTLNNQAKQELIQLLSEYFTRRGRFLAQVISADLQNLPAQNPLNGNVQSLLNGNAQNPLNGNAQSLLNGNAQNPLNGNAQSLLNGNAQSLLNGNGQANNHHNSVNHTIVAPEAIQPQQTVESNPTQTNISETLKGKVSQPETEQPTLNVEQLLINLVVEQTGYSSETIGLDAKLLEDLSLDSIKAGELIATAAKECGVAGKIDPSSLANASLQEIAMVIQSEMPDQPNIKSLQGITSQNSTSNSAALETFSASKLLSQLDQMSEEEVNSLLSLSLS